jgi:hypothetical protein
MQHLQKTGGVGVPAFGIYLILPFNFQLWTVNLLSGSAIMREETYN